MQQVAVDAARQSATLTLTTTVSATADGRSVGGGGISMADYVALGAQAMTESARGLMESRTHDAITSPESDRESDRSHHTITRLLATGKIVRCKVGPGSYCSPHHRMPIDSRNLGSNACR